MMGWNWNNQQQQQSLVPGTSGDGGNNGPNGGVLCVKVMTDEQMELLKKQISAYATICDQLNEMHRTITAQHDSFAVHKITTRHRWTSTPIQLQILEAKFEQGIWTPNKEKVAEITKELAQHGPVTEQNVYTWFQNRRARSKRKQQAEAQNNVNAEAKAGVESLKEKLTKAKSILPFQLAASNSYMDNVYFQDAEINSLTHYLYEDSTGGNPLASEMETPRSSSPYGHREGYDGKMA